MGMFDYFNIDVSLLPTVPSELQLRDDGRYTFQTKDTAMQSMSTYIQDRGHALTLKRTSGHYVPGEPCDDYTDFQKAIASLGSYVVTDTWYEEQTINDVITFYTDLEHPESDGTDRYVSGWIEYNATYTNGIIKSIVVAEYTKPKILSDEQIRERDEAHERSRVEFREKMIDRRMNRRTAEERLIDSIDELARNKLSLYDETDLVKALNGITTLIAEYRSKYDPFYKEQR